MVSAWSSRTRGAWPKSGEDVKAILQFYFLCLLTLSARAQTGFTFDSFFTSQMVLQRSANTLIYGKGPADKTAEIKFEGKVVAKDIKPAPDSSFWRATLNLSDAPSVGTLDITWKTGWLSSQSTKLTNVLLGDVWLVSGWERQGVDGRWTDDISRTTKGVGASRFWNLMGYGLNTAWPPWEGWPESDAQLFPNLALRLAVELENSGPVGIVLLPRNALTPALANPGREFSGSFTTNWAFLGKGVAEAQKWRSDFLIDCKHRDIVTNVPPIVEYDRPAFVPSDAFSPSLFPAQNFSFKGVIWPRQP